MVNVVGDISGKTPVVTAVLKKGQKFSFPFSVPVWINIAFLAVLPFPYTPGQNGS
jgi:hypothetical protein